MTMSSTATVGAPLDKARRDLSDASDALATYWSRGASDLDYRAADLHMATEALMRAISSVVLAVERVSNETAGLLNRELDR
jgi:hypothetical protein